MARKVFISYRRKDSSYQAREIFQSLSAALPADHVFMDVDSIPLGQDFRRVLTGWVAQCDVMLALIGPNWIAIDPRSGSSRLHDPEDFVRIEIATALARGIPVVPVLLDGTPMPGRDMLPLELGELPDRQSEFASFRSFEADIARLMKGLGIGQPLPAAAVAAEPGPPRTELRVEAPSMPPGDEDASFVATKLARNVVEYLVDSGMRVSSDLTGRQPTRAPTHVLSMRVERAGDDLAITAEISTADGSIHALSALAGPAAFLREHYKVLPETLVAEMDVSAADLAPLRSVKRATSEPLAYFAFLAARHLASAKRLKDAQKLLARAVEIDPVFAAAHAGMAEIAELTGEPPDVALGHHRTALGLDPDFRRLRLFAPSQMGNPVAVLRSIAADMPWQAIAPDLEYRLLEASDYDCAVHAWRFPPDRHDIRVERAISSVGQTVAELRERSGALLAVNAGFFDLDIRSRLAPVGLLIVEGREVNAFDPEKARNPLTGILYRKGAEFGIIPARERTKLQAPDIAVQSGPLIVDPGGRNGIRTNNFDRLNRSAIGIDNEGRLLAVHIVGGLSLFEFGELLSAQGADGLQCERAINLDGGPSSQVSCLTPTFSLESRGLWTINSALVVRPK